MGHLHGNQKIDAFCFALVLVLVVCGKQENDPGGRAGGARQLLA
eukprot:COSAG06_NODE_33125_length_495_cov_0.431818_1_plen_43_part_10